MFVAKFLFVMAVLGGGLSAPAPATSFLGEVHDFLHLVPTEKILKVVTDYLAYDEEVQDFVAYMHTEEFKNIVRAVDSQPEYIQFLNLLEQDGFDAYKYVNVIHTLLGMRGLDNPLKDKTPKPTLTGGINGLINDVKVLVDEKSVTEFYEDILASNPKFQTLVDKFKGDDFKKMITKLGDVPEVTELLDRLTSSRSN